MGTESISPQETRGREMVAFLKTANAVDLKGEIALSPTELPKCKYFVKFPDKLTNLFPGSYIAPELFLTEISPNRTKEHAELTLKLLGQEKAGSYRDPIFVQGNEEDKFSINVWNGLTNPEAIELAELATKDLKNDEQSRAIYQDRLFDLSKAQLYKLRNFSTPNNSLEYHDDCLASGDSIIGDITRRLADENERRRLMQYGVSVTIDGPATAQGILFLKKFAEVNNIKLHLDVGYMAFGLSEGNDIGGGVREHANYITHPPEILSKIDPELASKLLLLKRGGDIQVVGDMGTAIQNVSKQVMSNMRAEFSRDFNPLFKDREDNYITGNEGSYMVKMPVHIQNYLPETVYMAKGGFHCYAADKYFGQNKNVTMIDASRMWIKGLGYGAAYYEHGDKPKGS